MWAQAACFFCKSTVGVQELPYKGGDQAVCEKCRKTLAKCDICGLPSNLKPHRDGRVFCPACKKDGVWTQAAAEGVVREVVAFLSPILGADGFKQLPPIRLCDKDELQTKFVEGGRAMDVAAFYRPYNPEQVYLLSGTSPVELKAVLSHELTHAWQSRKCPQQDRALSEGFATWTQYQYFLAQGERREAEALTRHRDPDYGASLVKLLALEKKLGRKGLVDWVQKARNF